MSSDVHKLLTEVHDSTIFSEWKKNHEKAYLSHFFCSLKADFSLKEGWDIGFFNPDDSKMTVFACNETGVAVKDAEDGVFSKEKPVVEKVRIDDVKISFADALGKAKEVFPKLFEKMPLGDGFVVLQKLEGKTLWNFTFISRTLQFCNLRLDAESGEEVTHQVVDVVNKELSS